jgi:putative flippase GtrA
MSDLLPKKTEQRIFFFLLVGASAAALHWASVVILVQHILWPPLLANIVGWLIAFVLSFSGHYYLTFRDQAAPITRALKRFFAVSAVGFGINEGLFAIALHLQLRYDIALLGVLISVAILTYFLAKHWAFLNT